MKRFEWILTCLAAGAAAYKQLTTGQILAIEKAHAPLDYLQRDDENGYLAPILIVRTPGTENSTKVQTHFTSFFDGLSEDWRITKDEFSADTPIAKDVHFTNIIASRDPPGVKEEDVQRLMLSAHYDSKLEPEGFIGAIDSAVPCAVLMYVVNTIEKALNSKWKKASDAKTGLEIVFFDGEEAFKDWTDTDSIYGARQMASSLESQKYPAGTSKRSKLDTIDIMVLLDLLGAPNPYIPSYFRSTDWLHQELARTQHRLLQLGLLKSRAETFFPRPPAFQLGGRIGDDHIPFLQRGVPVLHLIPAIFPDVWHKITDDPEHLDMDTVHDWALIMTVFTAEYLELGDGFQTLLHSSTDL
ncbi:hypothetical protein TRVA0_009S02762 [Trichomonascus vanleenenianus]|uniref:uncharacterized protein n=1 Tax=Trichomonascus vanleenenianus TaxID=2268995 RepID=UPI003ECA8606